MNRNLLFIVIAIVIGACSERKEVDLIIHNATIYTVDDSFSTSEALAVKDGKIVEIGPEHQILNGYIAKQTVDAEQGYLYPGFVDAHSHFLGYGREKQRLNLLGTQSYDEVIERIRDYIADHDSPWVIGRGWDENDWETKSFPDNDTLSTLFPDHFIAVKRIDGHAYLASKNVMELARVDASTQVSGGKVIVKNGRATGVLIDDAMNLIDDVLPAPDEEFDRRALMIAQKDCFKVGLTSVTCAGLPVEDIRLIDEVQKEGLLKMRIYAMFSASNDLLKSMSEHRIETERLTARSIKLYADGALGSRGAKLIEPYTDDTLNDGILIVTMDSIVTWAKACYASDFQLNVHCIGDLANRHTLDAMGRVLGGTNDRRWRIEHAQVVHPKDRSKYGAFNIIPSMQPTHATSDMYWAKDRLGGVRIHHAYTLKSLMDENGLIALGTDFPVEGISPLGTFYAAVARKDPSGYPEDGFLFDEALSREEALRGVTIWAALANFDDSTRGSIEVGKFADFVLLDRDLLKCETASILSTTVLKTWLNGELVHE